MKPFSLVCLLAAAALTPAVAQKADPFTGRWDLVVTPKAANVKAYPDRMEVGVKDGELVNESKGANLKTTRKFDDFKLHIEFNCPDDGNSGIFLRGRYEVQVEYEKVDANDKFHSIGSVYSMLSPAVELPRTPGKWESFDITLGGRWLTVVRNGVKTIDNQEIAGTTGGALDSNEGEPGPFYIQGDHTGGMKYRNITIQVPKK